MATDTTTIPCSDWEEFLLDAYAYIGEKTNGTTAVDFTRRGERIVASFWRERAPARSRLYMHSPDLKSSAFSAPPRILCVAEGLILIRVAIHCREPIGIRNEGCDYFIYDVDCSSLQRLPHRGSISISDNEVGLLRRGRGRGGRYTVTALVAAGSPNMFTLHLLHSHSQAWNSINVSLKEPQVPFPVDIPKHAYDLFRHQTSTVIALGGKGGTMGWVDLWRGILLCDVLSKDPTVQAVPLPVPVAQLEPRNGDSIGLGCPKQLRGIAAIKKNRSLRLIELKISGKRLPDADKETGRISVRFDNWTITTWSKLNLTNSFDDWEIERPPLPAGIIDVDDLVRTQLLEYNLLQPTPKDNTVADALELNLENLWVTRPTPSMYDKNVVYLIAAAKFLHPKSYVLAVDVDDKKVQGVAEFGTNRELSAGIIYCPGSGSML